MMEASGNNVALVMSYSGHKSLESFKIYLHAPTQGCIATDQRIESVGLFLATFAGTKGWRKLREQVIKTFEGRRMPYHSHLTPA
jgi:hypothetical protein